MNLVDARRDSNGTVWWRCEGGWTSQRRYATNPHAKVHGTQQVTRKRKRPPMARKPGIHKPTEPKPTLKTMGGIVIQDEHRMEPIFGGKLRVYSTCKDCGELMQVIRPDEQVHPCCTPRPTKVETLARGWLSCIEAGDEESAALTEAEIEKIDNQPPKLKAAALRYVSWGWPVFPLRANSKQPATKHGFKDATTDPERVKRWWTRHPDHNIGLPTGINFDVIDIDPVNGGVISFDNLLIGDTKGANKFRAIDMHGVVCTASGGLHLYVKPTGRGFVNVLPGIDYRGTGGYVVAPSSWLGRRGRSWSWITTPSPKIKVQP